MNAYLLILPAALLVAYSQIIVKWRTTSHGFSSEVGAGMVSYLVKFFSDPMILSAYAAALMGSVVWLFIVAKLPLTIAFPLYIGVTFGLVLIGGWVFLSESMTANRMIAIVLIFSGIVVGVKT